MIHQSKPGSPETFTFTIPFKLSDLEMTMEQAECSSGLMSPRSVTSECSVMSDVSSVNPDEVIDLSLAKAAVTAVQTGSLAPLIKEELRCMVQSKRLLQGKDELTVDVQESEHNTQKLTPEEEDKRNRRRERNKLAAQKCRRLRKEKADQLEKETVRLEDCNKELRQTIENLEKEKEKLHKLLQRHDKSTQCGDTMMIAD